MYFYTDVIALEYWVFFAMVGLIGLQGLFVLIYLYAHRRNRQTIQHWEMFALQIGFDNAKGYWDLDQLRAYTQTLYEAAIRDATNRKPGPR